MWTMTIYIKIQTDGSMQVILQVNVKKFCKSNRKVLKTKNKTGVKANFFKTAGQKSKESFVSVWIMLYNKPFINFAYSLFKPARCVHKEISDPIFLFKDFAVPYSMGLIIQLILIWFFEIYLFLHAFCAPVHIRTQT